MARGNSLSKKNPQQIMPKRAVQGPIHKQPQKTSQKPVHKKTQFYIKDIVENILSGLIIGATIFVGGVNCGTMSNILGLYDKLIHSISNIFKSFSYSFLNLLQISIGIIAGIFLFSKMVLELIQNFEYPMMYLFTGAILGSLPSIYRRGKTKKFRPIYLFWTLLGGSLVYALNFLPKNQFLTEPTDFRGYGMLFICGGLSAIALMIPGISVSHILLVMGMYQPVLLAIVQINLLHLILIFFGFFAGILLTAKILSFAMKHFPAQTHLMIIGFMLAEIISIFPGIINNYLMIACIAGLIFGAGGIYLINR